MNPLLNYKKDVLIKEKYKYKYKYISLGFSVSAVEAQACGTATIISDIPGLMEATNPGVTSVVVPRKNPEKLAESICGIYADATWREQLGKNGRKFVLDNYELNNYFLKIKMFFKYKSYTGEFYVR